MSAESPPPRFRFHLSTLILTVLVAGALLGPHLAPFHLDAQGPGDVVEVTSYGYPFSFYHSYKEKAKSGGSGGEGMSGNPLAAVLNFCIVLMPVLVFSERLIRFRAGEARSGKLTWIPIAAGVLTSLLGGLILKANLEPGEAPSRSSSGQGAPPSSWRIVLVLERGWPIASYRLITGDLVEDTATFWTNDAISHTKRLEDRVRDSNTAFLITQRNARADYTGREILLNLVASAFILASAYLVFEYLLLKMTRWWTRRRGSESSSRPSPA